MSEASVTSWNSLRAMYYSNELLSVVVVPELGAKIASIRDRNGREWLEQPSLPLTQRTTRGGDPVFIEGDMCGWDECAPTIAPCSVQGVNLPDHGELWSKPWEQGPNDWLTVEGSVWPYHFSRRAKLDGSRLLLDYRVVSGDQGFPFLWAAHPQFKAEPGTQVLLPSEVTRLIDTTTRSTSQFVEVEPVDHLDAVAPGHCRKLFVAADVRVNETTLRHPDGSSVTLSWRGPEYLGIWLDRAGFARHEVIAIEPTTGFTDSCERAASRAQVMTLAPRAQLSWSLSVSVSA